MHSEHPSHSSPMANTGDPRGLLALGAFLFISQVFVGGPWLGYHGLLIAAIGLLMIAFPPAISPPLPWRILAIFSLVLGCASFLPVSSIGMPSWRIALENAGVDTGTAIVVQQRHAAENLAIIAITVAAWFWVVGFRFSVNLVKHLCLAFVVAVALYALFARLMQLPPEKPGQPAHYGFFPNRNHTATYLAMGFTCGIGCLFQSIRDKRHLVAIISVAALSICGFAICAWSLSRGGILLAAVGAVLFVASVGIRYIGNNGRRALMLLAIAAIGGFATLQTAVKSRILDSLTKVSSAMDKEATPASPEDLASFAPERTSMAESLDFRVPISLDALSLIREHPWTGVGAGQFSVVFPQYRNRSCVANDSDCLHPESDWIWAACELGVPSALLMLVLVLVAIAHSVKLIRHGKNRAARAGCLAAACILPIHGLFDVPGHKLSLSLVAAVLYAASLDYSPRWRWLEHTGRTGWRIGGSLCLLVGLCLCSNWWIGSPQLAISAPKAARAKAIPLVEQDGVQKAAATAAGQVYNPSTESDPLEKALGILRSSDPLAPLDRSNLRYRSLIGLQFDDKLDEVLKLQERERILDPFWVALPFLQASSLVGTAPNHAEPLIHETLRRASIIEKIQPDHPWSRQKTLDRMRSYSYTQPDLLKILPKSQ